MLESKSFIKLGTCIFNLNYLAEIELIKPEKQNGFSNIRLVNYTGKELFTTATEKELQELYA